MTQLKCPDCEKVVEKGARVCPTCGLNRKYFVALGSDIYAESKILQKIEGLATLDNLVEAQNRTTHAVRSLAMILVAVPIVALLVTIGFVVAAHTGSLLTLVFVAVLGVIIYIFTLVVALDELGRSKVRDE